MTELENLKAIQLERDKYISLTKELTKEADAKIENLLVAAINAVSTDIANELKNKYNYAYDKQIREKQKLIIEKYEDYFQLTIPYYFKDIISWEIKDSTLNILYHGEHFDGDDNEFKFVADLSLRTIDDITDEFNQLLNGWKELDSSLAALQAEEKKKKEKQSLPSLKKQLENLQKKIKELE
jgi:hypothetical protein